MPLQDYPDWQQPLAQAEIVTENLTYTIAAGGASHLGGAYDMSSYRSFTMTIRAYSTAAATAFNRLFLVIQWFSPGAPGSPFQFVEEYDFRAGDSSLGAFTTQDGGVRIEDRCHGGAVQYQLFNFGVNQVTVLSTLYGSTRERPERYLRGFDAVAPDSLGSSMSHLADVQGAVTGGGAFTYYPMKLYEGRVRLRYATVTTQHTISLIQPNGTSIQSDIVAAGVTLEKEVLFPAKSMAIEVINNGAGNGTHRIQVIGQRENR